MLTLRAKTPSAAELAWGRISLGWLAVVVCGLYVVGKTKPFAPDSRWRGCILAGGRRSSGRSDRVWSAHAMGGRGRDNGADVTIVSNIMSTRPATMSVSAGPAPR